MQQLASDISQQLIEQQVRSITAMELGEVVMAKLRDLDAVAYVRFACIYRRFKDADEIMDAIHTVAPSETKDKLCH